MERDIASALERAKRQLTAATRALTAGDIDDLAGILAAAGASVAKAQIATAYTIGQRDARAESADLTAPLVASLAPSPANESPSNGG